MNRSWMMRFLVLSLLLFLLGSWLLWSGPAPGIESKGGDSELMAYIALASSVVSLLTALAGLLKTVIEARANRGNTSRKKAGRK